MTDPDHFPEIVQFMQQAAPFPALPEAVLPEYVHHFTIHYLKAGDHSERLKDDALYWLRTGVAKINDSNHRLYDQLEETGCFGHALAGLPDEAHLTIVEDALVYRLGSEHVNTLANEYPAFEHFIKQSRHRYLHHVEAPVQEQVLNLPLQQFARRTPITISPDASAQQAAHLMSQLHVSCLPVVKQSELRGIITDRDLRARLVANGLPTDTPVAEVMTTPVQTIYADQQVMDALLMMALKKVHHLPIVERHPTTSKVGKTSSMPHESALVGVITSTDLMQLQQQSPIFIAAEIMRQTELEGIIRCCKRVPTFLSQLADAQLSADRISKILTTVYDAVTQRLLALGEARFGPPPRPYCWLVFGSHAREELHLASDQDNGLLFANTDSTGAESIQVDEDRYFAQLSEWVCEGLYECGLAKCPGDIMASNPEHRMTLAQWQEKFSGWLSTPTPNALLKVSTFFDLRPLAGEMGLADLLMAHIADSASSNQLFLGLLAQNAAAYPPPLGVFGQLKTEKDPERGACLDLKRCGLFQLTELARLYGFATASSEFCATSTVERVRQAQGSPHLTQEDAEELLLGFQRLHSLRLTLQITRLAKSLPLDNLVPVKSLTHFEKHQLKDIFAIIDRAQQAALTKFAGGRQQ
ncbi:DUF294 nucleotidyltransferase-like domain-containing protein [Corallincola platygyrae]|uniref:DUF294 nucleotidyltransferase-like domain-containing protein n=1 Tax=Corallincola platygyrae TaxID=1193278 RepID=A0ABW4XIC9_9GAMM